MDVRCQMSDVGGRREKTDVGGPMSEGGGRREGMDGETEGRRDGLLVAESLCL